MKTAKSNAAFHRVHERLLLVAGELAHGPIRHEKVDGVQPRFVEQDVERIGKLDVEPGAAQVASQERGGFLRFVPIPTAINDECFFHELIQFADGESRRQRFGLPAR